MVVTPTPVLTTNKGYLLMATSDYTPELITKFWSRVNRNGSIPAHCPELGACWEWTAGCFNTGYGQFHVNKIGRGAHRVSWEINKHDIPSGLWVLHKCDNPSCVNPSHLFLGTMLDNVADRVAKNRTPRGREHGLKVSGANGSKVKLTVEQVLYIRERYARGGISQRKLAKELGISKSQIGAIVRLESWKEDCSCF